MCPCADVRIKQVAKLVRRAPKSAPLRGEADAWKSEEAMVWEGTAKVQGDVEQSKPGGAQRSACTPTGKCLESKGLEQCLPPFVGNLHSRAAVSGVCPLMAAAWGTERRTW